MAGFVERISVIIDTKTDQAASALKSFRTEVAAADGFVGKFKAGMGSLTSSASAFLNSGAGMATAAAAVGAAAWEAATASADLGIEIGKLADATGLSTEQASRWLEVADDMGIGADTVAGLIEKMTKNLGATPEKFEAMGISVQHADDGTADMNATLLLAIDRINNIASPTKKAKAMADLFGKGWTEAAELVNMSTKDIEDRLNSVSDAKVFSNQDVAESRDFRDAMADLSDTLGDLTITIGKELVPAIAGLAKLANGVVGLADKLGLLKTPLGFVSDNIANLGAGIEQLFGLDGDGFLSHLVAVAAETGKFGDVLAWVNTPARGLTVTAGDLADNLDDVAGAAKDAADGLWDTESASLDAADAYQAMNEATAESVRLGLDENATQAERDAAYRKVRQSQISATEAIVKQAEAYAAEKGAIDGSKLSIGLQISELERQRLKYPELTAMIDEYIAKLKSIPSQVYTNVGTSASGGSNTGKKGNWGVVGVESVDAGDGRGQRDSAAPIVVQLMLDGRAIAEITAYQEAQKRGTR